MPVNLETRIATLLADTALDRAAKISELRQLEADALARQRAGTEGMAADDVHEGSDLNLIEQALRALGVDAIDQGPASI